MDVFQIAILVLLSVFYLAYIIKAFMLKRRGITANLLGKGDKPQNAIVIERLLKFATLIGAAVQFGSALFANAAWSLVMPFVGKLIGTALTGIGILFFILAMLTMKDNWRAGFVNNQNTILVTGGIYHISRNPAFVGFDLLYIGCAVVYPNIVHTIVAILVVILLHYQILGEEKYCSVAFGDVYSRYTAKTMRYIGTDLKIAKKLKSRAKQLRVDIPAVFIAMKKKETPWQAKILAAIAVVYALSPIDFIPDFIPVIGLLDDVIILPGLIALVVKLIPADVFKDCREEAADLWTDGKPKKWYYALPIILIWLLIIYLVVKAIWW